MKKEEVYDYVKDWLENKRIQVYFQSKKKGHKRYLRISEENLYELCYKLVDLMKKNMV